MARVFISYRRSDSGLIAGRVAERLEKAFGAKNVFYDLDRLVPGVEWLQALSKTLTECDVLLAIVGNNWLDRSDGDLPRLFSPGDWVRLEIETALNRGLPIVPLLIVPTTMPTEHELPDSLSRFSQFQASRLDAGQDFNHHMERVIAQIRRLVGEPEKPIFYALAQVKRIGILGGFAFIELAMKADDENELQTFIDPAIEPHGLELLSIDAVFRMLPETFAGDEREEELRTLYDAAVKQGIAFGIHEFTPNEEDEQNKD